MNLCKASCFPVNSLAQVSHLYLSLNCSSSGKAFGNLTQGTLLSSAVPPSSALCNDLPEIITKSCFYTAISYSKILLSPLSRMPCPSLHLRWRWILPLSRQQLEVTGRDLPTSEFQPRLSEPVSDRGTRCAFSCPNCIENSLKWCLQTFSFDFPSCMFANF